MNLLLTAEAAVTDAAATTADATATGGLFGGGMWMSFLYLAIIIVFFYFMLYRPQKKEQKRMAAMLASMEIGDVVVTTGGFYGVLIDVNEEDVIVEFGNNKNCRIPMKKAAIAQIEKANVES